MKKLEALISMCITGAIAASSVALLIAQSIIAASFQWYLVVFAVMVALAITCFTLSVCEFIDELKK